MRGVGGERKEAVRGVGGRVSAEADSPGAEGGGVSGLMDVMVTDGLTDGGRGRVRGGGGEVGGEGTPFVGRGAAGESGMLGGGGEAG